MRLGHSGLAAIAAVVVMLAGCGPDHPAPTEALPPPPVGVTPYPPARSDRITLNTPIYADFDTDLDPRSVNSSNIYFKIDEARYTVTISWNASTRRLTLVPAAVLSLGRTYTIEITPRVRRASGEPLFPAGWFWQFSTTSIRPLVTPDPPNASTLVSPFMRLRWDATEASAGAVTYQVFWSADSNSVKNRSATNVLGDGNRWIPKIRWPGGVTYWAVRATNLRTGEVVEGPLWRFETIPFLSPTQETILNALHWGWMNSNQPPLCNQVSFTAAPGTIAAIRWQLPPRGTRLQVAEWNATIFPQVSAALVLRATRQWSGCLDPSNPPVAIGPPLAAGRRTSVGYLFQSDTLTAFVEAAARDGDLFGYTVEPNRSVSFVTLNAADPTAGAMRMLWYPGIPEPQK